MLAAVCVSAQESVTGIFNWYDPESLTPAYSAPTDADRYGEYVGNVDFTDNGVTVRIYDDNVSQQSQKARFLYGYLTQTVELRVYGDSEILVTAPEGYVVQRVAFEGAEVDGYYLVAEDPQSTFDGQTWTAATAGREASFIVDARRTSITSMTVTCQQAAGVADLTADDNEPAIWYTLTGLRLQGQPTVPGMYICRRGDLTRTVAVH